MIPAYCDGEALVPTLDSVQRSLQILGLSDSRIVVSDSTPDTCTVDAARTWANRFGVQLEIDYSTSRRTQKAALNAAFDHPAVLQADVVVMLASDVLIPPNSLAALLECLVIGRVDVAVGVKDADPSASSWRRGAGAWQMRAVARAAAMMPESAERAQGCLWAARRSFLEDFRFTVDDGSVADDVDLVRAIRFLGLRMGNAAEARALAVPPGSLRDFALATCRAFAAEPEHSRDRPQLKAGVMEAFHDPKGFMLYLIYRAVCRVCRRRLIAPQDLGRDWGRAQSTLRRAESEAR